MRCWRSAAPAVGHAVGEGRARQRLGDDVYEAMLRQKLLVQVQARDVILAA